VHRSRLFVLLPFLAGAVAACSADTAADADSSDSDVQPIVDAHTFVVTATAGQDVDIADTELRFTRAGHEDLLARRHGDVIVSTAGFARRVDAVKDDGDRIVVSTELASLEELFVQGGMKEALDPAAQQDGPPGQIKTQSLTMPLLSFALAGVRLDGTPFGSLAITDGEFSFQPHVDVEAKVKNRALDHFLLRAEGDVHASVHVSFDLHKQPYTTTGLFLGRPGRVIASASPVTTIVWIGTVPVLLTVKLELLVGGALEISGEASGDETFTVDASLAAGAEYSDHAWHNVGGASFSSTPIGHTTVPVHTLAGDVTLTGRVTLLIYELAGPFAALQVYGGIGKEGDLDTSQWFGQVGVRGMFGGRVEILGRAIGGYEVQLFDEKAKFDL
jgi:hypothetical protein